MTTITNPEVFERIDLETYCQIFLLKIDKPGKQAVLDAIKIIERNEDVQSAELNDIITLEPVTNEPAEENILLEEQQIISDQQGTAELNSVASNDSYKSRQYAISQMELSRAWDITTGDSSVLVGVLDTGIDRNHPDLDGNIETSLGANFTSETDGAWVDNVGHGTHVAGIIAAEGNNGLGITGVCWNVKMVSIKILKREENPETGMIEGIGTPESIIYAINYANQNNIMILNYSGGGYEPKSTVENAISNYAGLFVCAAGNDTKNTDIHNHYPSCYDCSNIISVASIDSYRNLASYSNYGATTVDLAAPGVSILSTFPTSLCGNTCKVDEHHEVSYHTCSGTSMAAPQVTGVAALIKSCYPSATSAQIKQYIINGTVETPSLVGKVLTGGRLNAFNSLMLAAKAVPSNQKTTLVSGHFKLETNYYQVACFSKVGTVRTNLVTWTTRDAAVSLESGTVVWTGTSFDFDKIQDKVVAGDFNGDGYDDIAVLYDFENNETGIYIWRGSSTGLYNYGFVWSSTSFNADCINGKVAAGDFNGDGKDDIAAFYYYGDKYTKLFMWRGTSSGVSLTGDSSRWYSNSFIGTNIDYRVISGDFNRDGKDDIVAFYDLSNQQLRFFLWDGTSTGVSLHNKNGEFDVYNVNASYMSRKIVAVDYYTDGYCDIWYLYNGVHWRVLSSAGEFFLWYQF